MWMVVCGLWLSGVVGSVGGGGAVDSVVGDGVYVWVWLVVWLYCPVREQQLYSGPSSTAPPQHCPVSTALSAQPCVNHCRAHPGLGWREGTGSPAYLTLPPLSVGAACSLSTEKRGSYLSLYRTVK